MGLQGIALALGLLDTHVKQAQLRVSQVNTQDGFLAVRFQLLTSQPSDYLTRMTAECDASNTLAFTHWKGQPDSPRVITLQPLCGLL